ncbi:nicotinate phosphoribosyltransferase [Planosporangium mesophilum]|uniref:Nicotinate phosphoribosyltransferase n=1 Tax=Planosporangium mesophilum TaxID=689768 RepID=A0A8J3TRE8_9ACTN|nr:nicotinate phosphoribosyltransferase [Planosporangium mesophilum]NJC85950.1 nicotinate phosphoribosyltransferase [Planosporangium mesophilum]GII25950.1 nicotinate phosphoribosyltransferase [Planosporangium mesophilum]
MSGLYTDLYELRMAASYLRRGLVGPATFSLVIRALPPERGFLVAAGLADALTFLERFDFDDAELDYLRTSRSLPDDAVQALRDLRFTGDVWAVPEGRMVFAGEPLLEVTAPAAEAQLVETALLNIVTHQTAIASKAARCRLAAGGADLVDFSFRRTHGLEAAMAVARASAIVGFAATSNTEAGRRYGLRVTGTMAHSYVESFPDERSAFAAFATDYPTDTVFLVDTYDTLGGVRTAIDVTRQLRLSGPIGVRLDSGDLARLAVAARQLLDREGLTDARIVASGGLDEYAIADLVGSGAPIDAYGVGTRMGVSADAPYLDSAYKLVTFGDRPVMKLSPGKVTLPGAKQVFRGAGGGADVIGLRTEVAPPGHTLLLRPVMAVGQRLATTDEYGPADDVAAARHRFDDDLARLPEPTRRVYDPSTPEPTISPALQRLREDVLGALLDRRAAERLPVSG